MIVSPTGSPERGIGRVHDQGVQGHGQATMRVTITGARGRIGRQLVEELSEAHELRLLDRAPLPGLVSVVADLSRGPRPTGGRWWRRLPPRRAPRWERAFDGAEAIVHLAGNANPAAAWPEVLRDNVQATWNVLDAAARYGARRVILASSCRWVLGLEKVPTSGWSGLQLTSATPPRPRTAYGASKAWGELAGRMFVDDGRLPSVVAVRIGHFKPEPPAGEPERRLWVRPADARTLFRRCVEANFEGFHIVYALSREAAETFDLSYTRSLLGWEPGDR